MLTEITPLAAPPVALSKYLRGNFLVSISNARHAIKWKNLSHSNLWWISQSMRQLSGNRQAVTQPAPPRSSLHPSTTTKRQRMCLLLKNQSELSCDILLQTFKCQLSVTDMRAKHKKSEIQGICMTMLTFTKWALLQVLVTVRSYQCSYYAHSLDVVASNYGN